MNLYDWIGEICVIFSNDFSAAQFPIDPHPARTYRCQKCQSSLPQDCNELTWNLAQPAGLGWSALTWDILDGYMGEMIYWYRWETCHWITEWSQTIFKKSISMCFHYKGMCQVYHSWRLLKEANAQRQGETESHWIQHILVDWIVIDFKGGCTQAIVPKIDGPWFDMW